MQTNNKYYLLFMLVIALMKHGNNGVWKDQISLIPCGIGEIQTGSWPDPDRIPTRSWPSGGVRSEGSSNGPDLDMTISRGVRILTPS